MRLACVKHAASVRSEPGSNSQVHQRSDPTALTAKPKRQRTDPTQLWHPGQPRSAQTRKGPNQPEQPKGNLQSVRNASNEYVTNDPNPAKSRSILANPNHNQTNQPPTRSHAKATHRTPPTYPFLAYANVKEQSQAARSTSRVRNASAALIEGLAP